MYEWCRAARARAARSHRDWPTGRFPATRRVIRTWHPPWMTGVRQILARAGRFVHKTHVMAPDAGGPLTGLQCLRMPDRAAGALGAVSFKGVAKGEGMDLEDTDNLTIFAPTDKGKAELKSGSTQLSTVALELMVMFDGKSPISTIAKGVAGARPGQIAEAVTALLKDKLIDIVKTGETPDGDFGSFFEMPVGALPDSVSDKFREEAEKGAMSLDRGGYYIGVAQRALAKKTPNSGSKYTVLLIEDNEPFVADVKMLLRL